MVTFAPRRPVDSPQVVDGGSVFPNSRPESDAGAFRDRTRKSPSLTGPVAFLRGLLDAKRAPSNERSLAQRAIDVIGRRALQVAPETRAAGRRTMSRLPGPGGRPSSPSGGGSKPLR